MCKGHIAKAANRTRRTAKPIVASARCRLQTWLPAIALACLPGSMALASGRLIYTWPEHSHGCTGTLQACIDAAEPDSIVEIRGGFQSASGEARHTYNEIRESLTINKPLLVQPEPGIDAVFAAGHTITAQMNQSAYFNELSLSGFTMVRGTIRITDAGSDAAPLTYTLRNLRFLGAAQGTGSAIQVIRQRPAAVGSLGSTFYITSNTIDFQNDNGRLGGIFIGQGSGEAGQVANAINALWVSGNQIIRRKSDGIDSSGINVIVGPSQPAGSLGIRIHGNIVRGPFMRPIAVWANGYAGPAALPLRVFNNMIVGQGQANANYAIDIANTDSQLDYRLVNNTVVYNQMGAIRIVNSISGPAGTTGALYNNLVADNSAGVALLGIPHVPASTHNFFFRTGSHNGYVPAETDITSLEDPLLASDSFAAPSAERTDSGPRSPVVNAGNNEPILELTEFDLTGEKRVVEGTVDIGAVEATFDHAAIVTANVPDPVPNTLAIDPWVAPAVLRGQEYAIVTPIDTGLAGAAEPFGVYREIGSSPVQWKIFHQRHPSNGTSAPMAVGERYSVLIPWSNDQTMDSGTGKYGFRHTARCASCTGAPYSNLDQDRVSPLPNLLHNERNAIAIATPRYENPDGTTGYHYRRIGLEYARYDADGSTPATWFVVNQDNQPLPASGTESRSFNVVVAAPGSPNAFKVSASYGLLQSVPISHPLLNDNPCAAPAVGLNNSLFPSDTITPPLLPTPPSHPFFLTDTAYALRYVPAAVYGAAGHWHIVVPGGGVFAATTGFNVIVDGGQAHRCLGDLAPIDVFQHGFE